MLKLVFIGLVVSALNNPSPGSGEQAKPYQNQAAAKQAEASATNAVAKASIPVPVGNLNAPSSQERPENRSANAVQQPPNEWWSDPNWCMVVVTIVMVGVSIGQFVMYLLQWRIMRQTLSVSSRAYITIVSDGPPIEHQRTNEFSIVFRNTGQTPAYNVRCHITWEYFPKPDALWPKAKHFKSMEEIEEAVESEGSSTGTLGAGQQWIIDCPMSERDDGRTFDDARRMGLGESATVFVYGEIRYRTFEKGRRTEFCMVSFRRQNTDRGVPGLFFTNYGAHNHAD